MLVKIIIFVVAFYLVAWLLNYVSYSILKNKIIKNKKWDLNICCGKTDGNGINADIFQHEKIPNFVIVDVYSLPFKANAFENVLSSHTIEHIDDPNKFFNELQRVGNKITLITPPLWDISAVLNLLEHQWIFLSLKKVHHKLPKYIRLPFSRFIQNRFGQKVSA